MHGDLLTNASSDSWEWPLSIDTNDRSFVQTIRVTIDPSDIPIVDSSQHVHTVDQNSKNRSAIHHDSKVNFLEASVCSLLGRTLEKVGNCDSLKTSKRLIKGSLGFPVLLLC